MNATLGLYFGSDFVAAAVEPFPGKFALLRHGNQPTHALYFNVVNDRIDYGRTYRGRQGVKSVNFYQRITDPTAGFRLHGYEQPPEALLRPVLENVRKNYREILDSFGAAEGLRSARIVARRAFADNVPGEARTHIEAYLQRENFELEGEIHSSLPELLLQSPTADPAAGAARIGVAEAFGPHFNVSLLRRGENQWQRVHHRAFPGYGLDMRVGQVANTVVDKINRNLHLLDESAQRREVEGLALAAERWNEQLLQSRRPSLQVRAELQALPGQPQNVTLIKAEIENATKLRAEQLARFCVETLAAHTEIAALDQLWLLGDSLENYQVREALQRHFDPQKTIARGDAAEFEALRALLDDAPAPKKARPAAAQTAPRTEVRPQAAPPSDPGMKSQLFVPEQPRIVDRVRTVDLKAGDKLVMYWSPDRRIVAEYVGNLKFVLRAHQNSSVVTGDQFEMKSARVGAQAEMKHILRPSTGKRFAAYRTGVIEKIERI